MDTHKLDALQAALDDMDPIELDALLARVQQTAAAKRAGGMTFTFDFDATNDPRKGVPYVARLTWKDGKIEREFVDLQKTWGRKAVTITGQYTARAGEIVEIRTGGSWNNDYRDAYIVLHDGTLHQLCSMQSSSGVSRLKAYLAGTIDLDTLVTR